MSRTELQHLELGSSVLRLLPRMVLSSSAIWLLTSNSIFSFQEWSYVGFWVLQISAMLRIGIVLCRDLVAAIFEQRQTSNSGIWCWFRFPNCSRFSSVGENSWPCVLVFDHVWPWGFSGTLWTWSRSQGSGLGRHADVGWAWTSSWIRICNREGHGGARTKP